MRLATKEIIDRAWHSRTVVPALNVPYLPMIEPLVAALRDVRAFGLIQVARLEWEKFGVKSMRHVRDEYERHKDERFTRLHLDHIPVIKAIIGEAIELGFESLMVDGSRLSLEQNIRATGWVAEKAHAAGIPVEAELGAVLGHEAGPMPPYEELFASGKGFTDPGEAKRFVQETGLDWLSVAIGNVHGAISGAAAKKEKIAARLNIDHLARLRDAAGVPLVLHGGSGIPADCIRDAIRHGIAKINIATALRKAYLARCEESIAKGQEAAYEAAVHLLTKELELTNSADRIRSGQA